MKDLKKFSIVLINAILLSFLNAEIRTPAIIGNNMVLQQNQKNSIWGWDNPGQSIEVLISGQSLKGKADKNGYWKIALNPMKASLVSW